MNNEKASYNFENIKELVITIDNSVSLSNIAIFLENIECRKYKILSKKIPV